MGVGKGIAAARNLDTVAVAAQQVGTDRTQRLEVDQELGCKEPRSGVRQVVYWVERVGSLQEQVGLNAK